MSGAPASADDDRIAQQLAVETLRGGDVANLEGHVVEADEGRPRGRLRRRDTRDPAEDEREKGIRVLPFRQEREQIGHLCGEMTLSRSEGIDDCGSIVICLMSAR